MKEATYKGHKLFNYFYVKCPGQAKYKHRKRISGCQGLDRKEEWKVNAYQYGDAFRGNKMF